MTITPATAITPSDQSGVRRVPRMRADGCGQEGLKQDVTGGSIRLSCVKDWTDAMRNATRRERGGEGTLTDE